MDLGACLESPTGLHSELYLEGTANRRLVLYYDKARMEITNPAGDPDSPWYVTNGLLVAELISGEMQFGDDTFFELAPANINVAGDADDPDGPTYADLANLRGDAENRGTATITERIDGAGNVSDDPDLAANDVALATYDDVTRHNIAAPFWDFMNASGPVWNGTGYTTERLFLDRLVGTGRPVTEPYWADVRVAGTSKLVLLQCFERRCLTYTPDNPAGWQVEAGNVGLHYFRWRYGRDAGPHPLATEKIAPPPNGGMYLGQYEWLEGDIAAFEEAIGQDVALWSPHGTMEYIDGVPYFDADAAEEAWDAGKISIVNAFETEPLSEELIEGFTIDRLLSGEFEPHLERLAAEFRTFGRPLWFITSREPNGIGASSFGGFGPDGDKTTAWAIVNQQGFDEFDPSQFPNPDLYAGLGDPDVSDGVERLAAAQRYYYDYFVRQQGLTFLTFDTMGWAVNTDQAFENWLEDLGPDVDEEYALRLLASSHAFENFYPGDAYVDWVSINFYMLDFYAEFWDGLEEDFIIEPRILPGPSQPALRGDSRDCSRQTGLFPGVRLPRWDDGRFGLGGRENHNRDDGHHRGLSRDWRVRDVVLPPELVRHLSL